ncbi:MAG TPA: MerR family transcriptional regulator [Iamia sp.]|jgi:DNA-binding transcriptional MerR regulator|nr:MerR family transcriptional regulator [Iamia sp.]
MTLTDTLVAVETLDEPTLSIAEVVDRTGVSHDTLRYYEKEGLLAPPRDGGGRRRYREVDIGRVVFITRMRQSEMPIRVLQRYVALVEEGPATERQRLEIMEAHRDAVLARRTELDEALAIIEMKIEIYGGTLGSAGSCGA